MSDFKDVELEFPIEEWIDNKCSSYYHLGQPMEREAFHRGVQFIIAWMKQEQENLNLIEESHGKETNFRLTGNHIICKGCKGSIDLSILKVYAIEYCYCGKIRGRRLDTENVTFWENFNSETRNSDHTEDFKIRFKPI